MQDRFDWTEHFQGTRSLSGAVRERLRRSAQILRFEKGSRIFGPDFVPDRFLFLLDGVIRVFQTSQTGRDIVLYRVEAGQSCVLTTACILAEEAYSAEGLAETDVEAVMLPKLAFDRLAAEEPVFRSFVFAAYSRRLIDLLRVVDDVAFGKMDVRLADRLLGLGHGRKDIQVTHQQLASELGTAREVISRLMHDFQKRGLITQARGRVTFLDKAGLQVLADSLL